MSDVYRNLRSEGNICFYIYFWTKKILEITWQGSIRDTQRINKMLCDQSCILSRTGTYSVTASSAIFTNGRKAGTAFKISAVTKVTMKKVLAK